MVRVSVGVERTGASPLPPEQAERLEGTLAEHRRQENVQRKVGVERSPSDKAAPARPAIESARMSSGAWIRYTASSAGVHGSDPAFADAAAPPCSPVSQLRSSVTSVTRSAPASPSDACQSARAVCSLNRATARAERIGQEAGQHRLRREVARDASGVDGLPSERRERRPEAQVHPAHQAAPVRIAKPAHRASSDRSSGSAKGMDLPFRLITRRASPVAYAASSFWRCSCASRSAASTDG